MQIVETQIILITSIIILAYNFMAGITSHREGGIPELL